MYVRTRRGAPSGRTADVGAFGGNNNAAAQFHRVHAGVSEQWAADQWAKPRWWFVIRRYFFVLSMAARILCTCVVVASGIAVCMLHVPIYASLDAIEHIYVPSFISVRYDRSSMMSDGTAVVVTGGRLVSRHPDGTADVGGAFHMELSHVRDEVLPPPDGDAATTSICGTEAAQSANRALLATLSGLAPSSVIMACDVVFSHRMSAERSGGGDSSSSSSSQQQQQQPVSGWAVGCLCVPAIASLDDQTATVAGAAVGVKQRWSVHFVASRNATESMGAAVLSVGHLFPTEAMVAQSGELVLVGTNVSNGRRFAGTASSASAVDLVLLRVAIVALPVGGGGDATAVAFHASATVLQSVWQAATDAFDSATLTPIVVPPQAADDDSARRLRSAALVAFASAASGQIRILQVSWVAPLVGGVGNLSSSIVNATLVGVTSMAPGSGTGVCCGSSPLFLLSANATTTAIPGGAYPPAAAMSGGVELWFLVYRSCPSQCTQTIYRDQQQTDPTAPCYSTRLSTFKYSLDYGMFSALLPVSLPNSTVLQFMDAIADRYVSGVPTTSSSSSSSLYAHAVRLALVVQTNNNADPTVHLHVTDTGTANRVSVFACRWLGGYRVEGIVAAVHNNGNAIDVAVTGRLALDVLAVGGQRMLVVAPPTARRFPPAGSLVCIGPASRSILVADNGGFPSSTAAADGGHCFGRVISTEDFMLR